MKISIAETAKAEHGTPEASAATLAAPRKAEATAGMPKQYGVDDAEPRPRYWELFEGGVAVDTATGMKERLRQIVIEQACFVD